jgi:Arm DNA-binding domain
VGFFTSTRSLTVAKRAGKTLDIKTIDALKPREATYRVSDGAGLLLEVRPTGSKAWLCRTTTNGKRRDLGLGGYPVVSLAAARAKAAEALRQAQSGTDPVEHRAEVERQRKAAQHAKQQASERTFRAVAEVCISAEAPGWKNPRTADMWRNSLRDYAFPTIGDMPVDAIDRNAVMAAVGDVWAAKPATYHNRSNGVSIIPKFGGGQDRFLKI